MRNLIAALCLISLSACAVVPAIAADCITPEAMMARAVQLELPIFYTLHGVDIGDEDKAEVTIFEADGAYLAIAFERGCYAGYRQLDAEGVEELIAENQRKADGA